ncbi:CoA transferase [Streptosporangium sp. NBC_01755]|uniref:CaiB/BaiF CoA transferase family protein n=1 Tax=unclassified Streptosporangium TaxID=2632669 RepID=UPI002DD7B0EF|nr:MULTISPECIES: CaiB/BaiF CoA-transferase family protein [unclassified Streptosporangium]WSA28193.1 CoA transferase [Streptosporangium sp. NBC_01810]WSD00330.1 CoA transferase [Streptosporangium sp. NBC_01755]
MQDPTGPLKGMRVVDLSQQLPGPYTSLLLASLGAHVTKVEPPWGDAARSLDPDMFEAVNHGKVSVRLDLKSDVGRKTLHRMMTSADVFIEGFRPGVMDRLGCSAMDLHALNPSLIYCSISGYGQKGPLAGHPTHDLNLQAMVGAIPRFARLDRIGVPWVDLGTATTAALAIAAYWHAGVGVHLDLAMLDLAASWAAVKPRAVSDIEPSYGTFMSRDGDVFVLALLEDDMWVRLCRALRLTSWSAKHHLEHYRARQADAEGVRSRLEQEFALRSTGEVVALAAEFDLPINRVLDSTEVKTEQQLRLRSASRPGARCVPIPEHLLVDVESCPAVHNHGIEDQSTR